MIKSYNVNECLRDMAYDQAMKYKLVQREKKKNPKKASFIEIMQKIQRGELK